MTQIRNEIEVRMSNNSIAIVGATGLVGSTLISLLQESSLAFQNIYLIASQHSVNKTITFKEKILPIYDLSTFDFSQTNIAFFCVGNDLAATYIPKAVAAGNIVIDKSYYYRNHVDVPLIVPEVNLHALSQYKKMNIISNPNCSTIPIAVALKPIYDAVGIKRMNVATYQSVSGTGKDAMSELAEQSQQLLSQQTITPHVYTQQIAFNVLPHIDDFQENGYTREEMKIVWELRKIFVNPTLAINPTTVRVPVYVGHAAVVNIETEHKLTVTQAIELLNTVPSIKTYTGAYPYPTPAKDAAGNDYVHVGRVRQDISHERGLNLWVVSDNLRKGAALNAIQILEHLLKSERAIC
jgi:aspartate-semialdehyde dehydrogenase